MKKAFLFSGQGSQYVGMMRYFYDTYPECKNVLNTAEDVVKTNLKTLMFEGPVEKLNETVNTQPCVLCADLMAFEAVKHEGFSPDVVAGFSLGEYAALYAAGVFDLRTVFSVVKERACAMNLVGSSVKGGMVAVLGLPAEKVEELCSQVEGFVVPVNYNCPGQVVVSGDSESIKKFILLAKSVKVRVIEIPVSVPCHCKYMKEAGDVLEKVLSKATIKPPDIPVYMNVDAMPVNSGELTDCIKEKLVMQVQSPVFWNKILGNMKSDGIDCFVEIGPGSTLTNFVKRSLIGVKFCHVENEETLNETIKCLGEYI